MITRISTTIFLTIYFYALILTPFIQTEKCNANDTCVECFAESSGCSFWYCKSNNVEITGTLCQNTTSPKPTEKCTNGGKWTKIESNDKCPSPSPSPPTPSPNTTTTTSKTTITTNKPKTTTNNSTFTTTNSPYVKKSPNVLTILAIVASSLIVLIIIVFVAYKKVVKLYRRNVPYQTLND